EMIMLRDVERRLAAEIHLTPAPDSFLAERGYDASYGARPLRRAIQRFIEDPLSEKLLSGDLSRGDEVEVDIAPDGEQLVFRALTGTKA
ncbi:MAG: NDP-hexose 4-ketoreductase, partial [Gemmatimonadota bacterium]